MPKGPRVVAGDGEPDLVSVVIPTYQRAHCVGAAIQSALDQTHPRIEIIVVDDGSTDATGNVVAAFGKRVRYLRQPNGGASAARNRGLSESRGEFIALLDSDDAWFSWKIASQVQVLRSCPEVGMVWTDMVAVDDSSRRLHATYLRDLYPIHRETEIEKLCTAFEAAQLAPDVPQELSRTRVFVGDIFSQMLLGNHVHTPTVLMRRTSIAKIGGFDETFQIAGEDYEFHLRMCASEIVALMDLPSMEYRIDGGFDQITAPHRLVHMARGNLATIERWLDCPPKPTNLDPRRVRRRLADAHAWLGEEELRHGDAREGRRHLSTSVLMGFFGFRRLALLALSCLPTSLRERKLKTFHHASDSQG